MLAHHDGDQAEPVSREVVAFVRKEALASLDAVSAAYELFNGVYAEALKSHGAALEATRGAEEPKS
jgi:hypothetical protein